jgi:hypothetical protein
MPTRRETSGIAVHSPDVEDPSPAVRASGPLLGDRQRQQGEARRGDGRGRDPEAAAIARTGRRDQPRRLGRDGEDGEVVGRQGEGRHHRPAGDRAPSRTPQRANEEVERRRREHDEQGVRARLLRVPDEVRSGGDQCRRDQPGPRRKGLAGRGEGERDGRGAEDRGEGAKGHLPGAERVRPGPRERVVERPRALDRGHRVEGRAVVRVEDPGGGDGLAGVEALAAQGREANRAPDGDDQAEPQELRSPAHPVPQAPGTAACGFACPHAGNDTTRPVRYRAGGRLPLAIVSRRTARGGTLEGWAAWNRQRRCGGPAQGQGPTRCR